MGTYVRQGSTAGTNLKQKENYKQLKHRSANTIKFQLHRGLPNSSRPYGGLGVQLLSWWNAHLTCQEPLGSILSTAWNQACLHKCKFSSDMVKARGRSYSTQLSKFEVNMESLRPCQKQEWKIKRERRVRESYIILIYAQIPRFWIFRVKSYTKASRQAQWHTLDIASRREWQTHTE